MCGDPDATCCVPSLRAGVRRSPGDWCRGDERAPRSKRNAIRKSMWTRYGHSLSVLGPIIHKLRFLPREVMLPFQVCKAQFAFSWFPAQIAKTSANKMATRRLFRALPRTFMLCKTPRVRGCLQVPKRMVHQSEDNDPTDQDRIMLHGMQFHG